LKNGIAHLINGNMNKHLDSKRFVAFILAMIVFVIVVYTTSYTPIEIATAITLITGVYVGAQSIRPSSTPNTTKE
jgi:hypothetical protein